MDTHLYQEHIMDIKHLIITFIGLITLNPHSYATDNSVECSNDQSVQVGPFFSTTIITPIWKPFTQKVASITGCPLAIKSSPSFDIYLKHILNKESDIYTVPEHYMPSLISNGFTTLLRSKEPISGLIVSRIDLNGDKQAFNGSRFIIPSQYTRSYLEAQHWLKQHHLTDKVKMQFSVSLDTAAAAILNKTAETTVILSMIYDKLPETLKSKLYTYEIPRKFYIYIAIRKDSSVSLKNAAIKAKDKIGLTEWVTTDITEIRDTEPSRLFARQLKAFKEEHGFK
jgi:hypothetical protein